MNTISITKSGWSRLLVLFTLVLPLTAAHGSSTQEKPFADPPSLSQLFAPFAEEDPALTEIALEYYMRKYRVNAFEAGRRLAIQDKAAGIEDDIAALLGRDFAGVWYDAARGGRLQVGITRSASAYAERIIDIAAGYGVAGYTELREVRFSIDELVRTQETVYGRLRTMVDSGRARTSYNPKTNNVKVYVVTGLSSAEEARVTEIDRLDGVDIIRSGERSLFGNFNSCLVNKCDPPFRGGRGFIEQAGCTSAFPAVYRNDPSVMLVMTAGHCIFAAGNIGATWSAATEAGIENNIGTADGYVFAGGGGDEGVIRVDPSGFWANPAPVGRVVVKGTSVTTYNPLYPIHKDSTSSIGQILCSTGSSTGTRCAEVNDLGVDFTSQLNGSNFTVRNMGELDACVSKKGDSGGPLYKKNKAYGLHVGDAIGTFTCAEYYQGIRGAQNALNVSIIFAQ